MTMNEGRVFAEIHARTDRLKDFFVKPISALTVVHKGQNFILIVMKRSFPPHLPCPLTQPAPPLLGMKGT